MGREAQCLCQVGTAQVHTKVLLEATDVVIRGDLRRTISIRSIENLRVDGPKLIFRVGKDEMWFELGAVMAEKWRAAMLKTPPTLSQKLGIEPNTRVRAIGEIDSSELSDAIAVGKIVQNGKTDLVIARVDSVPSVQFAIDTSLPWLRSGAPLWLVYPKGKSGAIGETVILDLARRMGLRDTKVAAVSSKLTALRFSVPR